MFVRPVGFRDPRPPFWAEKGFRTTILIVVCAVAGLLVVGFDILPKLMNRTPGESVGRREGQAAATHPKRTGPKPVRFDGMLDRIQDGTAIDQFDTPFRHVLDFLAKADPKDLSKEINVEVPYADLKSDPTEWRAESIRVIGLLADVSPIRLDPPQGQIEFLYRVVVTDLSGDEGYMAFLIHRPPALKPRDLVQMDGVFVKMGTYDGLKGPVQAPLVVGWDLVPVKEKAANQMLDGSKVIMLLGTSALLIVLFLTYQALRTNRTLRRPTARVAHPAATAAATNPTPAAPTGDAVAASEDPKPPMTA